MGSSSHYIGKRQFETDGVVNDCPMVMQASQAYQETTDYFGLFISEKITKMEGHSFHNLQLKRNLMLVY